jgi:hypothetical protein
MKYANSKEWVFAFDTAAVDSLARRADVQDPSRYRLVAKECAKHGPSCVAVVYGDMIDHFAWAKTDPVSLAEKLVTSMLPQVEGPPG